MIISLIKKLMRLSFIMAFWALNTNRGDLSQDGKEYIDVCASLRMNRVIVGVNFVHSNYWLG